ncbi:hypothetical protein [Oceanicola sp. D3]|uniref:hypothetical protein n=1 Tax=Oceanicola sp. D3 TaxID=2587163 RepID=UPI00143D8580|nr:hypothetical protein [Oceanicola sp. D3]
MIAIDNAVELMLETFIELPKRINGLSLSRKLKSEITSNFPSLLDGVEEHAQERISGLDLGEIEWFHGLRNRLYHKGNGLTIERRKVEVYAELAKTLFSQLFLVEIELDEKMEMDVLGKFIASWTRLERSVRKLDNEDRAQPFSNSLSFLKYSKVISQKQFDTALRLRNVRNEVLHGPEEYPKAITPQALKELSELVEQMEGLIEK